MLKSEKTSVLVGRTHEMFKCIDVYKENGIYYVIAECVKCGERVTIKRNSWYHTKNCPKCVGWHHKPKTYAKCTDNNTGNYKRYYSIRERAKEVDGAIWHGWISWELFEQWCNANGITTETHRMKINKDATNFGPYSVEFRPKTRNNKNEPEIER